MKGRSLGKDIIWVTDFDCPYNTVWRVVWTDDEKCWCYLWGEKYEIEHTSPYGWKVL